MLELNHKIIWLLSFVVLFSMIQIVHAETTIISEDTILDDFIVGENDTLQIQPNVVLILEGELENFGLVENNGGTRFLAASGRFRQGRRAAPRRAAASQ